MRDENDTGPASQDLETVLGSGQNSRGRTVRRAIMAGAALVLAAGAWFGWQSLTQGGNASRTQYVTDAASLGEIVVKVTATGTVEPTNQVDISSELSGIVDVVKVDFNSVVKAGDVLAELDTEKLKATVESARAKLAAAKAKVTEAEATLFEARQDFERKQALAERRVTSSQDLEAARATFHRAEASVASAQADVLAAEAALKLNESDLEKTCICSPIDGIVLSRDVDPGQVVAASLQAPVLFTIAEDLTRVEVQVDVDEADIGQVHEGQTADFVVDAYPDLTFEATIKQLRYGSEVVQGVVTYKAILAASNPDLLLRPGMTATADIVVQHEKDVLTVANAALRFTPETTDEAQEDSRGFLDSLLFVRPRFRSPSAPLADGGQRRVWVLRDGNAVAVDVETGASDGRRTQISGGDLEAGDKVIVDAQTTSR